MRLFCLPRRNTSLCEKGGSSMRNRSWRQQDDGRFLTSRDVPPHWHRRSNHLRAGPMNYNFWQRKLLAFLHDPPHKAQDVAGHEQARETLSARLDSTPRTRYDHSTGRPTGSPPPQIASTDSVQEFARRSAARATPSGIPWVDLISRWLSSPRRKPLDRGSKAPNPAERGCSTPSPGRNTTG